MANIVEGLVAVKMPSKFDDSIRIKLEDGEWYSASQEMADKIRKGATVKLKVEQRGRNTFVEAAKELSAPAAGGGGGGKAPWKGKGGGGGYKPDPAREQSIHYQSSRKDALQLLDIMQTAGILKLGSKADLKEGILLGKLDQFTALFMEDIAEQGALKRHKDQAGETEDFKPDEEVAEEAAGEDFPDEETTDEDDF